MNSTSVLQTDTFAEGGADTLSIEYSDGYDSV